MKITTPTIALCIVSILAIVYGSLPPRQEKISEEEAEFIDFQEHEAIPVMDLASRYDQGYAQKRRKEKFVREHPDNTRVQTDGNDRSEFEDYVGYGTLAETELEERFDRNRAFAKRQQQQR